MKKVMIVLVAVCSLSMGMTHAQKMEKGSGLVSVGIGLFEGVGVSASYDHGLVDTWGPGLFTIGGYAGFSRWSQTYGLTKRTVNKFAIAPRATYRYQINDSFEVYGAVMTGLVFVQEEWDGRGSDGADLFMAINAGCRYSFSPTLSVFAEAGYDVTYIKGGLSFAF